MSLTSGLPLLARVPQERFTPQPSVPIVHVSLQHSTPSAFWEPRRDTRRRCIRKFFQLTPMMVSPLARCCRAERRTSVLSGLTTMQRGSAHETLSSSHSSAAKIEVIMLALVRRVERLWLRGIGSNKTRFPAPCDAVLRSFARNQKMDQLQQR